jgi:GTP cyclohydrolase II
MHSIPSTDACICSGIRCSIKIPTATMRCTVAMPLANGSTPNLVTLDGLVDGRDGHFALDFPARDDAIHPLVRVHSACKTGDVLGSLRCDCGPQLRESLNAFARYGGLLIYLEQEGRGIGLNRKIDAYKKQDEGYDTFEANRVLGFRDDERDYIVAAQILNALLPGRAIRLLTNNPEKAKSLEQYGIRVTECVPTGVYVSTANRRYLVAKRYAGHRFNLDPNLSANHLEP